MAYGYKAVKYKPFPIEGTDGETYELPPVNKLSFEDMQAVNEFSTTQGDMVKSGDIAKTFILKFCPKLADDKDFGPFDYLAAFSAYCSTNDKDAKLGE